MVHEIWSVTDKYGSFCAIYCPHVPKNHDHMVYYSRDMVCDGCNY